MSKRSAKKKETALVPEVVEPVLSRRHESVVVALVANPKISDAAKAAGVSEATVFRLMQNEAFQRRFKEARELALNGALGAVQGAATEAIATLHKNLSCGVPAAENQAAKIILDFTLKSREQLDILERLAAVEAKQKAGQVV